MNTVLKIFLSMSFSGSLLILALFSGKQLLKDKISRQWQYYIWLIVIMRLLLPFGPETNLMGKTYQAVEQTLTRAASLPGQQNLPSLPGGFSVPADDPGQSSQKTDNPVKNLAADHPLQETISLLINYSWLIWLAAALGMLIRKVTIYQSFIQFANAGMTPVSDIGFLDQLSITAGQADIKGPVELCINPLISTPLLIGFFYPCIVLPNMDISEKEFRYIALHELTHYRRRDVFYKWLVQVTVCLHWFNPLVYLMSREITRACEFSCDEAVLEKMGWDNAQDYGKALLDAMAAVGKYRESFGAVTLSENKQLLKERLGAIMKFKGQSKMVKVLTAVLTLCVVFGAAFVGIYSTGFAAEKFYAANSSNYPRSAESVTSPAPDGSEKGASSSTWARQAEQYYEADSLPLFEAVFSRLDEETQREWLYRIYEDKEIAFFSVGIGQLDADAPLVQQFAEKFYQDHSVSFFSVAADQMNKESLEAWLSRALEDQQVSFQSVLFDKLNMEDEWEALEKEWAEKQLEDYREAGVTKNGKDYYYQEQLVNIFLDLRPNKSVYTLDINPEGTVSIRIIRSEEGEIIGVSYMTEAEVTELLGELKG